MYLAAITMRVCVFANNHSMLLGGDHAAEPILVKALLHGNMPGVYTEDALLQGAVLANTVEGMLQQRISPDIAASQQPAQRGESQSNKRKAPAGDSLLCALALVQSLLRQYACISSKKLNNTRVQTQRGLPEQ